MPRRPHLFWLSLCAFLAALASVPSPALAGTFVEDFTTSQFQDTLNTTALWDTVAGEIKLPPFATSLVGNYAGSTECYGVAVSGDYIYLADGAAGLRILDGSDPASPSLIGTYDTPGGGEKVVVAGDHAFVADYAGLVIVDISDPSAPGLAGVYWTPGIARDVRVAGDHALVADGVDGGLQVVDISDPTTPTLAGSFNTQGEARGVDCAGDVAYVADYYSGLLVLDISDPTNPDSIGIYDTPGRAYDVAVDGNHAFVADYNYGLQVIDITDPANPTLAGNLDPAGAIMRRVTVDGNLAYLADVNGGLHMIDISDPTAPSLIETYETPGNSQDVAVWGNEAYVADLSQGLQVLRVSDPAVPPTLVGSHEYYWGYGRRVAIAGNHAYLANESGGMLTYDIDDPSNPILIDTYDVPHWANGVAVSGDLAILASDTLVIFLDISNPANAVTAGSYGSATARNLATSGDHVFVADGSSGLLILDMSDPANPLLAGSAPTNHTCMDVVVSGDYVYAADHYDGLLVFDVSDPTTPVAIGSYNTPGTTVSVAVAGDYAYLASRDEGMEVVDIGDPTNPVLVATRSAGDAQDVEISGDFAYVACSDSGLQIFDITDPTDPTYAGGLGSIDDPRDVAISGDHLFLAVDDVQLQVVRVKERRFDRVANQARSTEIDGANRGVIQAKLTTSQSDSIRWELSADGGANWQEFLPGASWKNFTSPGADLRWRSSHFYEGGGVDPACTDLQVDWLTDAPIVESIADVPHDQGKQVTVTWTRSGYDQVEGDTITHYSVWRSLTGVEAAKFRASGAPETTIDQVGESFSGPAYRTKTVGGTSNVWEWLANLPAHFFEQYAYTSVTLYDSTDLSDGYHHFLVSAHTSDPYVFYDSDPDSGYSVDNLAPAAPLNLRLSGPNTISWKRNTEEDLDHYAIYVSADSGLAPDPSGRVGATTDTTFLLPDTTAGKYVLVTALDFAGNESDPSNTIWNTTGVGGGSGAVPAAFFLGPAVPNPFNPMTTIAYGIPAGTPSSRITIKVYSFLGREVRTLVEADRGPGSYTVAWDGTDRNGVALPSGAYFYRITWSGGTETKRMVLIR